MDFISQTLQTAAAKFEPVRLPFVLPDFTRTSWVSDRTREAWGERLRRVTDIWEAIEFESVRVGLRPAVLLAVRPADFTRRESEAHENGLAIATVTRVRQEDRLSASITEAQDGAPTSLRVAIGQREAVEHIALAYSRGDVIAVGMALGYPACCCRFFQQQCIQNRYRDTTWPMAAASHTHASSHFRDLHCEGPSGANIFWRSLGIRAVPHLPCGFDCSDTVALAGSFLEIGQRLGFTKELEDLMTILSWPVEWSSLHGIAEIKTPILKISTVTDAFAYKHTVRRSGDSYPDAGAVGLNFPYNRPKKNKLSSSLAFRRGLTHEVTLAETKPE